MDLQKSFKSDKIYSFLLNLLSLLHLKNKKHIY
jgi:hypothetical protein